MRHIHPEWDVDSIVFSGEIISALVEDAALNTHSVFVHPSILDPYKLDMLFDSITYSKGFLVLFMTARFCGAHDFAEVRRCFELFDHKFVFLIFVLQGVRAYIKKFSFKNAVTNDLLTCLSASSGKDVVGFVQAWISRPGYPVVFADESGSVLRLSQRRFVADGSVVPSIPWPVAVDVCWGSEKTVSSHFLDKESIQVPLPVAEPPFVLLDSRCCNMYLVVYSPELWQRLLAHLSELVPVDLIGLIESRLLLARAGLVPSTQLLELCHRLEGQRNPRVFKTLVAALSSFGDVWRGSSPSMAILLDGLVQRVLESASISFAQTDGESSDEKDARLVALRRLAKIPGHPVAEKYKGKLANWKSLDKNDLMVALFAGTWDECVRVLEEAQGSSSEAMMLCTRALSEKKVSAEEEVAQEQFLDSLGSGGLFGFVCCFEDKVRLRKLFKAPRVFNLFNVMGLLSNPCTNMLQCTYEDGATPEVIAQLDELIASEPRIQPIVEECAVKIRGRISANIKWIQRDETAVRSFLTSIAPQQQHQPNYLVIGTALVVLTIAIGVFWKATRKEQ